MNSKLVRFFAQTSFLLVVLFGTSAVWANADMHGHHHNHSMTMEAPEVSPFDKVDVRDSLKSGPLPLHCVLKGHSADKPCPHLKKSQNVKDTAPRIESQCGNTDHPDQVLLKSFSSFFDLAQVQYPALFVDSSFPVTNEKLDSRLPEAILPPPRLA